MTDPFQEQISNFIDDELSPDECEFLVRRLQRDPESRSQLIRYHMIGAAMRGELRQADPDVLRRRLQHAIEGGGRMREPSVRRRGRLGVLVKPALGFAIAAGVAAVAVLTLKSVNLGSTQGLASPFSGPVQASEESAAATYVVPTGTERRRLVSPPIRLTNYLMQHGVYASHLSRTSVHSNVVATGQPDMTEQDEDPSQ